VDAWVWTGAAIDGGAIYFGDVRGKLYALDLASGTRRWVYEARDSFKATPLAANGKLYVVSMDTFVYAFDLSKVSPNAEGTVEFAATTWRNETLQRRLLSTPVLLGDDTLLVALFDGDVKVWALDTDGGARKLQFPPAPVATPAP
jgi:outer membrane protein assembly factor BamB